MIQTLNLNYPNPKSPSDPNLESPCDETLNRKDSNIQSPSDPSLKSPTDPNPKFSSDPNPKSPRDPNLKCPSDPNPKSPSDPNQLCHLFLPQDPNSSRCSRWSQNGSESLSCHRVQLWCQTKELAFDFAGKVRELGRGSREKWEKGGNFHKRDLAAQLGQARAAAANNESQILQKLPDSLKNQVFRIKYSLEN